MSGTNDRIQGSINNMYFRIENGKPKVKRHKTTSTMRNDIGVESQAGIDPEVQKKCEMANKKSHNPLSDMKRERSIEKGKDLGFN